MKKSFYYVFIVSLLIFSVQAFGQKNVIVVEPDQGLDIGALNDAIEAVDSVDRNNTIFELRRDGLYLLNGTIAHESYYTLHIRTEAGPGGKAVLQPAVDENGESGRQFQPSGNLTLEEVYLQGRDELGAMSSQPIRVNADSCRIIIDNCVLDYSGQSLVRTSSGNNTVIVTNSVLRNSILPDNPSNGRVIDSRGNPNDTLWISNSTIYNNGATQLRSDGGATLFANFDHNTVYQTSFNHNFALDYIFKANITNNIFYNFLYRGNNMDHDAFFAVDSIFDSGIEDYNDANRYFDLSNNNWFVDDTIGYILDEYGPDTLYMFYDWAPDDTVHYREALRKNWFASQDLLDLNIPAAVPTIMHFIANGQVDTAGLFREELTFTNPPPLNLDYWKFFTENGWAISGTNPPNAYADEDPDVLGEVTTGAFDFSYNANSRSATAADGGLPLGASRWLPYGPGTSVWDVKADVNEVRTYPNPFDNQVTFTIEASAASLVSIRVYDLVGKEIHSSFEPVNLGSNEVNVNLSKISHPGIYLYKIELQNGQGQKSVSSGKLIKK